MERRKVRLTIRRMSAVRTKHIPQMRSALGGAAGVSIVNRGQQRGLRGGAGRGAGPSACPVQSSTRVHRKTMTLNGIPSHKLHRDTFSAGALKKFFIILMGS